MSEGNVQLKPMEVKQCMAVYNIAMRTHYPSNFEDRQRWSEPNPVRTAENALRKLEEAFEADKKQHEENEPALANNQLIRDLITNQMKALGMPPHFFEVDQKSRKAIKPSIKRDAGYITDMQRHLKVRDGWETAQSQYVTAKVRFEGLKVEAERQKALADNAAAAKQKQEQEKREKDMKLAMVLVRYEMPAHSTWDDVLGYLCEKNERLALAIAMEQTRGDWNDGPRAVRNALYEPTTEVDKLIIADVSPLVYDWDGDGRVFRDCTWNYCAIYDSIEDQQLVADAQEAMANVRDY